MKTKSTSFLFIIVALTQICYGQHPVFFGMTQYGPDTSANLNNVCATGTIFRYNQYVTAGYPEVSVHDFTGTLDGSWPSGSLIKANNNLLYGLTTNGGIDSLGTIFSYDIATGAEQVLHYFSGGTDGKYPGLSLMQASNGILYGITSQGGSYNGGILFSYNINTGVETVLHSFGGAGDAVNPRCKLLQASNGKLYGLGGFDKIFSFDIGTGAEVVLHTFGSAGDGSSPMGSLIEATNGLLYGVTRTGGDSACGTIFSFNTTTNTERIVYSFRGVHGNDLHIDPNGYDAPGSSLMQASDGLLYGCASSTANTSPFGLYIYSFDITSGRDSLVASLSGVDGGGVQTQVAGSLIQASDGALYGLAAQGGSHGRGAIFRYIFGTQAQVIYSFGDELDNGHAPTGDLLEIAGPSGIQQEPTGFGLSIYPNPSCGKFNVTLSNDQSIYSLEVYNAIGEKVAQMMLDPMQNCIDLSGQSSGIYCVHIQSNGKSQTRELVINK